MYKPIVSFSALKGKPNATRWLGRSAPPTRDVWLLINDLKGSEILSRRMGSGSPSPGNAVPDLPSSIAIL